MDKNQIIIKSGLEIENNDLSLYYKNIYPKRYSFLKNYWKWHYNLRLINKFPRIMEYNGRIIGHASGIPFKTEINNNTYKGLWFVDLMIDPSFRRQNLATIASMDYFNFGEMHFGHPNEKSIKLLKKMGWGQNLDSYLHFFFIKPLNHHRYKRKTPKLVRTFINAIFSFLISPLYKIRSYSYNAISIEKVTKANIKSFEHSQKKGPNIISTYRDWDYIKWRILNSPDVSLYRIVTHKESGHKLLIKLIKGPITNHIEILMVKEPIDDHSIVKLTATICSWAVKHDFNYVLNYTTVKSRSNKLKWKLLSYRLAKNYIFFSQNPDMHRLLESSIPYWDLIDDDLEIF